MKKQFYLFVVLICLGCETKNDPLPDVNGKYKGIISGAELIGVPNITGSKNFLDTLDIVVIKNDENYIIQRFDTVDLIIPISDQRAYNIPVNENSNKVNSAFVSFIGDSVTIQGNWKYTYSEGGYTSTSINRRNYKFVGYRY